MQPLRLRRFSQIWETTGLPLAVGAGVMAATLILWHSLRAQEQAQIHRRVDFATASIGRQIRIQTEDRVQALVRMSRRWATQGGMTKDDWTADAESLLRDYPGYQAIEWIDSDFYVRWIVPLSGNEAAKDFNLGSEAYRREALETAREKHTASMTHTVTLVQGGEGILVYAPIFREADQSFVGFNLGVFRVQQLLDTILNDRVAPGYAIAIREGDIEIYRRTPAAMTAVESSPPQTLPTALQATWSQRTEIDLYGVIWEIEVWPTPALLAQEQSHLPTVVLISGLLMSGLLGWVTWLTQVAQRHRVQLIRESVERQQAEKDLELFFNLSPDLLCIAGTDGYFKRINPSFEKTLGHSAKDLLSQSFLSFVHPDDVDATLAEIDKLAAGTAALDFENRYRCQDGSYRWLNWVTVPVVETELLYAVARDTTDRRLTEENLRQFSTHLKHLHRINTTEYETYDALFEDCLDTGCQILGLETGIISQIENKVYTIRSVQSDLTSLAVDGVFALSDTYCAAVVKDRHTVTYRHVGGIESMRSHPVYQALQLESYLGTPIFVNNQIYGTLNFSSTQVRSDAFTSHEQEIIELMAQSIGRFLAADLAHQQQQAAAEALRESEARFRTVANSAPVLLWIADTDKRCTFFNQTWLTFTGRAVEQELGDGWFEGVHPDDADLCADTYTTAFDARQNFEMEYRLRRSDGQYRWILDRGIPRFTPDGSFAGYIGTCIDISDRHEVEKLKDEFISVVNHELRTPLTSILGSLDLLASGVLNTQPEKSQRMLQIAAKNADRLVRLINDMLDIERIESGKMTMTKQVCDGAELMTTAVNELQSLADQAGVNVWVMPLPVRIWADPDRILQVFTNLLSNAIKFSPRDSTVSLMATVQSEPGQLADQSVRQPQAADDSPLPRQTQQVVFQVQDQGRGIPADKLKTIFGRFQQVDASDSRKRGGTGLGLAVCRSIVQYHGGHIWVESLPDQGSTFFFTLPVLPSATPMPPTDLTQPLVLVCVDDPSVRAVVEAMLERQQYRAIAVASGQEAIDQASAQQPDVILLNLMMPEMNGWETLAALKSRSQTQNIPVIILSGLRPEDSANLPAEISDWIVKPPDESDLFQALQQAVVSQCQDLQVLIVEDDADLAQILITIFERHGITPHHAPTGRAAIQLSQQVTPNLLVLDLALPDGDGFTVVDWLRQHNQLCRVPLVVYTARDLDDTERQQLRLGQTLFLTTGRVSPDEFEKQVIQLISRITCQAGR
ncbi:MAG: PAS domain S-box protein [Cyanobacteria bacterium P01_F01_bin.4]